MQDQYDVIICGTGFVEMVLAGIMAVEKKKILVLDRNGPERYGGDCASLQLDALFKEFNRGKPPAELGRAAEYAVDLAPKLALGCGQLIQILSKSVAARYDMGFTVIQGSYVIHKGKIQKVPITPTEALASSLMGMFEKRRCAKFLEFVANFDPEDPKTYAKHDPRKLSFHELIDAFGLDKNTEGFIGTAIALELDAAFLSRPAIETIPKLQLYLESQLAYSESPYVYPVYGLGDIPQAFARLCAVFEGVFILDQPDMEVLLDANGKFEGVKAGDQIAKAPIVVGDPKYFPTKVKKIGDVVRAVCLLDHPIDGIAKGSHSCQIILPASETKRKTDMYIVQVSSIHRVCPKGKYLAIVSAVMETPNPEENVAPGLALLGKTIDVFIKTYPQYAPDPSKNVPGDLCYIGKSLDATSHFENETATICRLYEQIMGKPFKIDNFSVPSDEELQAKQADLIAKIKAEEAERVKAEGAAAPAAAAAAAAAPEAAAAAAAPAAGADFDPFAPPAADA